MTKKNRRGNGRPGESGDGDEAGAAGVDIEFPVEMLEEVLPYPACFAAYSKPFVHPILAGHAALVLNGPVFALGLVQKVARSRVYFGGQYFTHVLHGQTGWQGAAAGADGADFACDMAQQGAGGSCTAWVLMPGSGSPPRSGTSGQGSVAPQPSGPGRTTRRPAGPPEATAPNSPGQAASEGGEGDGSTSGSSSERHRRLRRTYTDEDKENLRQLGEALKRCATDDQRLCLVQEHMRANPGLGNAAYKTYAKAGRMQKLERMRALLDAVPLVPNLTQSGLGSRHGGGRPQSEARKWAVEWCSEKVITQEQSTSCSHRTPICIVTTVLGHEGAAVSLRHTHKAYCLDAYNARVSGLCWASFRAVCRGGTIGASLTLSLSLSLQALQEAKGRIRGTPKYVDQCNECCRLKAEMVTAAVQKDRVRVAELVVMLEAHYADSMAQRESWRRQVLALRAEQVTCQSLLAPMYQRDLVVEEDCARSLRLPFHGHETPNMDYYESCMFLGVLVMVDVMTDVPVIYLWDSTRLGRRAEVIGQIKQHYYYRHQRRRLLVFSDNCVAENKCNLTTWLDALLVARGQFEEVDRQYLPAGHSKFTPDRITSIFYRSLKGCTAYSPEDIINHVKQNLRLVEIYWVQPNLGRGAVTDERGLPLWDIAPALSERGVAIDGIRSYSRFVHRRGAPGQVDCSTLDGPIERRQCLREQEEVGESPTLGAWWVDKAVGSADPGAGWRCPAFSLLRGHPISATCCKGLTKRLEQVPEQHQGYLKDAVAERLGSGAADEPDLDEDLQAVARRAVVELAELKAESSGRPQDKAPCHYPFNAAESVVSSMVVEEEQDPGGVDGEGPADPPQKNIPPPKRRKTRVGQVRHRSQPATGTDGGGADGSDAEEGQEAAGGSRRRRSPAETGTELGGGPSAQGYGGSDLGGAEDVVSDLGEEVDGNRRFEPVVFVDSGSDRSRGRRATPISLDNVAAATAPTAAVRRAYQEIREASRDKRKVAPDGTRPGIGTGPLTVIGAQARVEAGRAESTGHHASEPQSDGTDLSSRRGRKKQGSSGDAARRKTKGQQNGQADAADDRGGRVAAAAFLVGASECPGGGPGCIASVQIHKGTEAHIRHRFLRDRTEAIAQVCNITVPNCRRTRGCGASKQRTSGQHPAPSRHPWTTLCGTSDR
jgi:hypothetical protein